MGKAQLSRQTIRSGYLYQWQSPASSMEADAQHPVLTCPDYVEPSR